MKKTISIFACLGIAACLPLPAENSQGLLPVDDGAYDCLRAALVMQGSVPILLERPLSAAYLAKARSELRDEAASATPLLGQCVDASLRAASFASDATFQHKENLILDLEGYYCRADSAVPWFYGYEEREAALSFPFSMSINKLMALGASLDLRENPDAVNKALVPGNYSNLPQNMAVIDYRFPFYTWATMGTDYASISIARSPVRWGNSFSGNLYLSDSAGFLDHVSANLVGENLNYTMFVASLDSRDEPGKTIPSVGSITTYNDIPRTFFAHRLEGRFFDRLRFALNEGTMVGGIEPELKYFLPYTIFHDYFNFDHATEYFGAEAEYVPWRYFSLYGQTVFNQFQSPFERDTYSSAATSIPDAYGWQLGARGYIPLGESFLDLGFEFTYTNPWMYIRENHSVSYSVEHYLASNVAGTSNYDVNCMGFYLGPDSELASLMLGWVYPGKASARLYLEYVIDGEQGFYTAYDNTAANVALTTPTGIPEYTKRIRLEGTYQILRGVSAYAKVNLAMVDNADHALGIADYDTQFTVGARFALSEFLGK